MRHDSPPCSRTAPNSARFRPSWHDSAMCGRTASNPARNGLPMARFAALFPHSVESSREQAPHGAIQRRAAAHRQIQPGTGSGWLNSPPCGRTSSNPARNGLPMARFAAVRPHSGESSQTPLSASWRDGGIGTVMGTTGKQRQRYVRLGDPPRENRGRLYAPFPLEKLWRNTKSQLVGWRFALSCFDLRHGGARV